MSFLAYVRQRRVTDDDAGDFILVARMDPDMPDAEHWSMLGEYLESREARPEVIAAALRVWRAFLTARRRAVAYEKGGGPPSRPAARNGTSRGRSRRDAAEAQPGVST